MNSYTNYKILITARSDEPTVPTTSTIHTAGFYSCHLDLRQAGVSFQGHPPGCQGALPCKDPGGLEQPGQASPSR